MLSRCRLALGVIYFKYNDFISGVLFYLDENIIPADLIHGGTAVIDALTKFCNKIW